MTFYQQEVFRIRDRYLPEQPVIDRLVSARRNMEERLGETLDLAGAARQACMSKFHFLRLFKRCYGRTPHQYLTEARMEKAKQLLAAQHSVAETCYYTGFQSTPSFTALFKKHTGLSPAAWRQKRNFR